MKTNTQMYFIALVLCVAILPGAVSAGSGQVSLASGTSTETAGYSLIDTVADPLNAALYSFGSWTSAAVESAYSKGQYHWTDNTQAPFGSGAEWISTAAAREGGATEDQWRLFKYVFTLPVGSTITSSLLSYSVDNAATVYLNGAEIGGTGYTYGAAPADQHTNEYYYWNKTFTADISGAVDGVNTLEFVVRNWFGSKSTDDNPTGLLYNGTIEYSTPAPEFPSIVVPVTMTIGLLGVVLLIRRRKI